MIYFPVSCSIWGSDRFFLPWSIVVQKIPRLRPIIVCPQAERMGLNISLLERGEPLEGWTSLPATSTDQKYRFYRLSPQKKLVPHFFGVWWFIFLYLFIYIYVSNMSFFWRKCWWVPANYASQFTREDNWKAWKLRWIALNKWCVAWWFFGWKSTFHLLNSPQVPGPNSVKKRRGGFEQPWNIISFSGNVPTMRSCYVLFQRFLGNFSPKKMREWSPI